MQAQIKFSPDICERFQQYNRHTTNKHKTINEFIAILKQICDLEQFYSRNLEKLADSTSKLILGKNTLKGVFIVFERLLSSLSEQAKNVAQNIKNDMMPYVATLVNPDNFKYLEDGKHVKEVYNQMAKKFKSLELYKRNYVKAYNNWSVNGSLSPTNIKQQLKSVLIAAQKDLTLNIQSYNEAVDLYILNVSQLTTMFCEAQTTRKKDLKSSIQKDLIFQIDRIKNIEYNIGNYCKNLDALQDKMFIHQKSLNQNNKIPLVKVSSSNYIQFLKDGVLDHSIISQRQNVLQLLKRQFIGQINQEQYNYALKQLYFALDYVSQARNFDMLKDIVSFGQLVFKTLPENEGQKKIISLKEGILGHDIFRDQQFWNDYSNQIITVIQRQNGSLGSFDVQQQSLQQALKFIRNIRINEIIKRNFISKLKNQLLNLKIEISALQNLSDTQKLEQNLVEVQKAPQIYNEQQSNSEEEISQYTKQQYDAFS